MKEIVALIVIILLGYCLHLDKEERSIQILPTKIEIYDLQSLKVDDESEYHLVGISKKGEVLSLHDLEKGEDIHIRYGNFTHSRIVVKYTNKGSGFNINDPILVELPWSFLIPIFKD